MLAQLARRHDAVQRLLPLAVAAYAHQQQRGLKLFDVSGEAAAGARRLGVWGRVAAGAAGCRIDTPLPPPPLHAAVQQGEAGGAEAQAAGA